MTSSSTSNPSSSSSSSSSCIEKTGNQVEKTISKIFTKLGYKIGISPRKTILYTILLTIACGIGFLRWTTESRPFKLWVPQQTIAENETNLYESYYTRISRFNNVIIRSSEDDDNNNGGGNVLVKDTLLEVMNMHLEIEKNKTMVDDVSYTFIDLCTKTGGACTTNTNGDICDCLVDSFLKLWNYDISTLENDDDILNTINSYPLYKKQSLEAIFGKPVFDVNDNIVSAEAFTISYFLKDRTQETGSDEDNTDSDPINEAWEEDVFLKVLQESVPKKYTSISVDYLSQRSFTDEFGGAITGDLIYVQISYILVFIFLGANLGKAIPGPGSRWTMSLAALVTVGLSIGASFGLSAGAFGLFYGPVHSLLPFILLGIGVDDAFVIVNAFNRERKVKRSAESNADLAKRAATGLARAGSSITVTSLTDLVAFGISSSSSLPALASFCGYAAIGIFFLWLFSATFFTATLVLDERRQRDNRRECVCCFTRKKELEEQEEGFEEGAIARYFRNYHSPLILSKLGKLIVLTIFSCLLGFGIWVSFKLS